MMKRQIIICIALAVALTTNGPLLALEKPFKDPQLTNFDFGVFCTTVPMNSTPAPKTIAGWIHTPGKTAAFHWKTTIVPASKSIAFGVRATARNTNILNAEIVVSHPKIKGRKQDRWATRFTTTKLTLDFYRFDFKEEMKPGHWVFKAVKKGKVLYRVDFKVVPADAALKMVAACKK